MSDSELLEGLKEIEQLASKKMDSFEGRIRTLEQNLPQAVLPFSGGSNGVASILKKSSEFGSFADRKITAAGASVPANAFFKSILTTETAGVSPQQSGIVTGVPTQRVFLRSLLRSVPANAASFEFTRELTADFIADSQWNNESPGQIEGGLKKVSEFTFENVVLPISTLAHTMQASRQVLSDSAALQDFLLARMRVGVEIAIEDQLLNGDGQFGRLSGFTKAGNHTVFTPQSGDTAIDSINRAKVALEAANHMCDIIVLNPEDAGAIERVKSQDEFYVLGNPSSGGLNSVWGTRVYRSNSMQQGDFLAIDLMAAALWMRQEIDLRFSEDDGDNFQRNLVTVRSEARCGLGVLQPSGIVYGALTV
jgi:HK97 family phage major capsid protein